jgi:Protein of unknown function (DUF3376)
VIETNWEAVAALVLETIPQIADPPANPSAAQLAQWNADIHALAASLTKLGQPTYVRLKISSAIDSFGNASCLVCDYTDSSNHAFLVQEVLRAWARGQGLFDQDSEGAEPWEPTTNQSDFVGTFDLAFPARRLKFVIAGVNWLYRDVGKSGIPPRLELDRVKQRLYSAVEALQRLSSGSGFSEEVQAGIRTCLGEALVMEYLEEHGFDFDDFLAEYTEDLTALNQTLRAFLGRERPLIAPALAGDLIESTGNWAPEIRRDLLVRYLGFPIWDALLYPVQALSDAAEGDELRVMRLSPFDSNRIVPLPTESKTAGAKLGHAFAFFSRKARENDYLWGRLDAAERMVRLLLTRYETETVNGQTTEERISGEEHPRYNEWCRQVMLAILDEDEAELQNVQEIVEDARGKVDALWQPA